MINAICFSSGRMHPQITAQLQSSALLIKLHVARDLNFLAGDTDGKIDWQSLGKPHLGVQSFRKWRMVVDSPIVSRWYGLQLLQSPHLSSSQSWDDINHLTTSYEWRSCLKDCRSYCSSLLDYDKSLVYTELSMCSDGISNHTAQCDVDCDVLYDPTCLSVFPEHTR